MRICGICKESKELNNFNKKGNGYHSWCKLCQNLYAKKHYRKNRERLLELSRKRQQKAKQFVWDLKDNQPCCDCKTRYPHYKMDFDHRPGEEKLMDIAQLTSAKALKAQILAEIAKCDLVCSNCHRERTWNRSH